MSQTGEKKNKSGVLICGAYGMRNAGDEAVLDAILAELREIDPDMPVAVLSRSPADTEEHHGVRAIHSFALPAMWRAMRSSALFINGGGSLVQDVTSTRSLWYYLYTLVAAKNRGCRVMMYGCGVGPVSHPGNRRLAGRTIDRYVDAITLREKQSLTTLRELGVRRPDIAVAAEPALSLAASGDAELDALFEKLGLDPKGRYFCVCVRRWPGMEQKRELFAAAADYAHARYGLTPLILSVNPRQDVESAEQVYALVQTPAALVTAPLEVPELIGFLARMEALLAMRLHALIFAASRAVPLIGVSYDPKVASFLDYIDQNNYIDFAELSEPEQLYAMIDAALQMDRPALEAATERLRAVERRNVETARRLLEEVET